MGARKSSKGKKTEHNELGKAPRELSIGERRELFVKKKTELSGDWRVIQDDQEDGVIPFDMLSLDHALRLYGMARRGTVYQFHGDEGAGKSTMAAAVNVNYQKRTDEPVAIFDFERTYKSSHLKRMGLDMSMAYIVQPDSIEGALKEAVDLMGQGVRLFTFDSIPRMRNKVDASEIKNGNAFKVQPGTHARAIQQFYDIILPYIAEVDGTLLMVNQTRSRIEMTNEANSASKGFSTVTNLDYTLPGGRANRYAISCMVELKTLKAYKPGKCEDEFILEAESQYGQEYLANEVRLRSLKNKVSGTGYRQSSIWIRYGMGIDENISIRQYARALKLIANHGKRWYVGESVDTALKVYDDKKAAIDDLVNDPNEEVLQALKALVVEKLKADSGIGALDVDENAARYLAGEDDFSSDNDNGLAATPVTDDDI